MKGTGASAGYGIGNVQIISESELKIKNRIVEDMTAEKQRFNDAVDRFCSDTNALADKTEAQIGKTEADIIRGHVFMISDPYMKSEIEKLIDGGQCAERAVETICDMFAQMFSASGDELTMQRASDVSDIKESLLKILLGVESVDIASLPNGTVIVARDLTPSMTVGINRDNVVGIITETGGKTSHSAILARALQIPAVLSVDNAVNELKNGDTVIIDGTSGEIFVNPNDDMLNKYTVLRSEYLAEQEKLKAFIGKPTVTKDGKTVELVCNIGSSDEAKIVMDNDGEGVGLFRTEFLFMDKKCVPSEDEQFEVYKKAALTLKGKPLIVRTLDVGGDKEIPYLGMKKEENPFLGFRAIRYCLKNREMYANQLHALLRASAFGDIRIMVPMVTCIDELRDVKSMIRDIMLQLDEDNIPYNKDIKIGVMIETPAAMLAADILAKEADFFSIGTNDLTQYIMAVDRGNPDVSYLYSAFNPSVLR
ncbi:MAG: phosphoenolpyruvate--protein phosphotransferase, partial [Acutalibacteraceae bacterium]